MSSPNLISKPTADPAVVADPVLPAEAADTLPCCGRRTVLQAAGLIALSGGALALAGCTTESGGTSGDQGSGGSPSAAGGSAAAVTVAAADVPVGGGVIVQQKYVVTQPAKGEFKGFSAVCTHQGCVVGSVTNGHIVCPCHGSEYDITTGNPTQGPAQKPLPAVLVKTSGGTVVIEG